MISRDFQNKDMVKPGMIEHYPFIHSELYPISKRKTFSKYLSAKVSFTLKNSMMQLAFND